MKFSTTTISFALLCSFLSIDTASGMWFSWGNLLFFLDICHHPSENCHPNCDGPLRPKMCDNICSNSSSNRRLDSNEIKWTEAACESIAQNSIYYQTCLDGATADCGEATLDADYAYTDASEYVDGDTNSVTGGVPEASRMSFLPYVVAASVATMFLILYAWKQKRDDDRLRNEDLLADDESCRGSVAKRFKRAVTTPPISQAIVGGETASTDYALA